MAAIWRSLSINTVGAIMTASVLIIVTVTKFTHGAWLVFVVMGVLIILMIGVNRYYRDVDKEIEADPTTTFGSSGDHAIVLVGRMSKPVLKALDYAIAARHESIEAVHVTIDDEATEKLIQEWDAMNIKVPLKVIASPYRDISAPLIKYIKARRAEHGSEVVTIYTPQYIVGHWWESVPAQPQGPSHPSQAHARARRRARPRAVAARLVRPHLRSPLAAAARSGSTR